jgi:hypothetical protein
MICNQNMLVKDCPEEYSRLAHLFNREFIASSIVGLRFIGKSRASVTLDGRRVDR